MSILEKEKLTQYCNSHAISLSASIAAKQSNDKYQSEGLFNDRI